MATARVSLVGTLPGEVWQTGFVVLHTTTAQIIADAVAAQETTLWGASGGVYADGTTWNKVVVRGFNVADGSSTGEVGEAATTRAGLGTKNLPNECAIVHTLRTGPGQPKGRMYFPPCDATLLNANGTIATATKDALADRLKAFFDALAAGTPSIEPHVYSPTLNLSFGVETIDVGSVMDVQRSRRNKQVEARSSRTLA